MGEQKPIPRKELARALRSLCRRLAAALIQGMAATDSSFDEIDERLGRKRGTAKAHMDNLLAGQAIRLRDISDFAFAMGSELSFRVIAKVEPLTPEKGE